MKESKDRPQDAFLTENVPSTDVKGNNNQAALNIGPAQTKNSEGSAAPSNNGTSYTPPDKEIASQPAAQVAANDITQILGKPKLTPEEREKKRRELIEKQKEARQRDEEARFRISNEGGVVNAADPNAVQPIEPREDLILQAIEFLSSPQVHNADEDKKLKFLLSKGLTRVEIDIAKDRMDKEPNVMDSVTIAQPPPVPPRTYQMVVARTPLWKHLILVLLITGAFSAAMIAVIKKFLGPAVTAIIFAKQQLYSHQLNLFRRFNEGLSTFFSLHRSTPRSKPFERNNANDDDDESPTPYEINEISTPPILLAPLATDLSELTEKLGIHQQNSAKYDTMQDLHLSLTSLATYLTSNIYSYSSWSSSNDSVSQVRSEIRSLKGMLISRRNFPKIPPVPAYSGQSQQSSSQPQQQINKPNEDVE